MSEYTCHSKGNDGISRVLNMTIGECELNYSVKGSTGLHTFKLLQTDNGVCGSMTETSNLDYEWRIGKPIRIDEVVDMSDGSFSVKFADSASSKHSFNHTYMCSNVSS